MCSDRENISWIIILILILIVLYLVNSESNSSRPLNFNTFFESV